MDTSDKMQDLVRASLALHKALLDFQRAAYEKEHGQIGTSSEYFGLVVNHADFTWLRSLSEVIAILDEELEKADPRQSEARKAAEALKQLLISESNEGFRKRLDQALESKNIFDHYQAVLRILDAVLTLK